MCRCTGYRPILEAFYKRSNCESSCKESKDGCCGGKSGDIEDAGVSLQGKQPSQIYCIENLRTTKSNNDTEGILKRIDDVLVKYINYTSLSLNVCKDNAR